MLGRALGRLVLAHRGRRYRRRVDPDEIGWMCGLVGPGDTTVDVGAHKGGYTYVMRRAVGSTGAVVAFEPQPELARYLHRCVRDFGWKNVEVVECALSGEPGARTLWRPTDDPSPAASLDGASLPPAPLGREVRVDTLDAVLRRRRGGPVRFLKCDVEGHELEVLRGATETLTRDRPHLLVECEVRHAPGGGVEDVFDHLRGLGYRGSFFLDGDRLELARFEAAVHQIEGRRPYVNNFLFEPTGG